MIGLASLYHLVHCVANSVLVISNGLLQTATRVAPSSEVPPAIVLRVSDIEADDETF